MDSSQSDVSQTSVFHQTEKQDAAVFIDFQQKKIATVYDDSENSLGTLDVFIHQARDIHNICIYHKQDVYAKLCLTSDPETPASTKIINGGGRNPVFNENLSFNLRSVDSSLKCEIWMLSRVRNYLEDQLLGFALVPVSEILLHNGRLEKEFPLSSTDLLHTPAGFVQLKVVYSGSQPDVIPFVVPPASENTEADDSDHLLIKSLDKIEFPDPQILIETNKMVEEYFAMSCEDVSSLSSDTDVKAQTEDNKKAPPPPSSDSPSSSTVSASASFGSSETPKFPTEENVQKTGETESSASGLVSVKFEPEPKVDHQEIVDLYMKSMQKFTESLAKMKLPMDFDSGPTSTESNTGSEQKTPASKKPASRVFYGSRAFF